jgi:hypothetical protein
MNSPPSLTNVFSCSRKTVTFPDSAETYNSFQPGSKASTSGSFPTECVGSTFMVVKSTTASLSFSSPATKASLSAASRAIPCGLSIQIDLQVTCVLQHGVSGWAPVSSRTR